MTDQNSTAEPGLFDVELLLKQARAYLAFGEQIRQFAEQSSDAGAQPPDWDTTLRQHFDRFKAAVAQSTEDSNADPDLARLWTLTLESWQQAASSLGVSAIAPRADQSADGWRPTSRSRANISNYCGSRRWLRWISWNNDCANARLPARLPTAYASCSTCGWIATKKPTAECCVAPSTANSAAVC